MGKKGAVLFLPSHGNWGSVLFLPFFYFVNSIIFSIISSVISSNSSLLLLLKSIGSPYLIVIFLNGFSPPLIPTGITLAPVLTAKNAAPSFAFSPFSMPFLVPSGNSAILSPFFNALSVVFNADTSLNDAEAKATSSLSNLSEDILSYYDINITLKCDKSENSEGFVILGARNVAGSGLVWNNNTPVESEEK